MSLCETSALKLFNHSQNAVNQRGVTLLIHCNLFFALALLQHFPHLPVDVTLGPPGFPYHIHARVHTHIHTKPGWMTSLFRLGFLYDPGISQLSPQTSVNNEGRHTAPLPAQSTLRFYTANLYRSYLGP